MPREPVPSFPQSKRPRRRSELEVSDDLRAVATGIAPPGVVGKQPVERVHVPLVERGTESCCEGLHPERVGPAEQGLHERTAGTRENDGAVRIMCSPPQERATWRRSLTPRSTCSPGST